MRAMSVLSASELELALRRTCARNEPNSDYLTLAELVSYSTLKPMLRAGGRLVLNDGLVLALPACQYIKT